MCEKRLLSSVEVLLEPSYFHCLKNKPTPSTTFKTKCRRPKKLPRKGEKKSTKNALK